MHERVRRLPAQALVLTSHILGTGLSGQIRSSYFISRELIGLGNGRLEAARLSVAFDVSFSRRMFMAVRSFARGESLGSMLFAPLADSICDKRSNDGQRAQDCRYRYTNYRLRSEYFNVS